MERGALLEFCRERPSRGRPLNKDTTMLSGDDNSAANRFRTTHWSVIASAREGVTPQAQAALASLCEAYWYPLYAFIRRQGYAIEDARDLTQEFFARLLE